MAINGIAQSLIGLKLTALPDEPTDLSQIQLSVGQKLWLVNQVLTGQSTAGMLAMVNQRDMI